MSLLDIYKAKKLGAGAGTFFDTAFAERTDAEYEDLTESVPYSVRRTAEGANVGPQCEDTIIGGTIGWNQLVKPISTSVVVPNGHKYYANINGNKYIGTSNESAITVNGATDNVHDLTNLFGIAIANYIYSLEQSKAGAGVAFFRKLFPNEFYSYAESTESVNASAHITKDASGSLIANYPLDSALTLRGIPKLDGNNKLFYDGDKYENDGTVTRKYWYVDLGTITPTLYNTSDGKLFRFNCPSPYVKQLPNTNTLPNIICAKYPTVKGNVRSNKTLSMPVNVSAFDIIDNDYSDASAFQKALSGVYVVYELNVTPATETADAYANPQRVTSNGYEEYEDYSVSQGFRDVSIPVGHNTKYKVRV